MYRRIFNLGVLGIFFILFSGGSPFLAADSLWAQESAAGVSTSGGASAQGFLEKKVSASEPKEDGEAGSSVVLSNGVREMLFSIGIVTLLFMVLILILKKFSPRERELTSDVFEILGKARFMHRQQICLMRCGQKLFLVSVSQNGVDRVGEIDDPEEVDRLTRCCHGEVLGTAAPRVKREAERDGA